MSLAAIRRGEPQAHGGGFGPAYLCRLRMEQKLKETFLIIKTSPGAPSLDCRYRPSGADK